MSTDLTPKSKGYTIGGAMAFVGARYGNEGRQKVLARLDPECRALAQGGFVPGGWYPMKHQVAVYEAIDRTFGSGDFRLCWQIGQFTAEYELSTIHKMLIRFGKPEHILRISGMLWGMYYSTGKMALENVAGGSAVAILRGFNPISKALCMDIAGWMERSLELTGAKDVHIVHSTCFMDGKGECRYEGSWKT